jgi:uncharacterized protein (TIGR02246 family)
MVAGMTSDAVRGLYEQLLSAWNNRDAKEFAAQFAADGTMVGFDGSQAAGAEIVEHIAPIFTDHPTATYVARIREIRELGGDAVLLRAIVGMVPPGKSELAPPANAIQALVARRTSDGWRIAHFQNTPARYDGRPELVEQHTAELAPLVGGAGIIG